MSFSLKQRLGAILFDAPRYTYLLTRKRFLNGGPAWMQVRNRDQKLHLSENPFGVKCDWLWTSDLYLPKIFPSFSNKLFSKAINTYPFDINPNNTPDHIEPEVSFIIGHRGTARIDLLLTTINAIANQRNCKIECIVVEQDVQSVIKDILPPWVTYVFTQVTVADMAYSRSWAFNEGVKHANSNCLIFHDNDLLVPTCYASETLALSKRGFDFINLKRFIFYLPENASSDVIFKHCISDKLEIDSIMQNAEGGGSITASKAAFERIGGFDERFVGWGSEDNEFWERALTQKTWEFGYLPLIHLWHESQAGKLDIENNDTKLLYNELSKQHPEDRISALTKNMADATDECVPVTNTDVS